MKKLGKIFRKYWQLVVAFLIIGFILFKFVLNSSGWFKSSPDKIKQIVVILYDSMMIVGTREKQMFRALENLNKSELNQVYKEFGVKGYGFNGAFVIGNQFDLFGWFMKELNKKEKAQMREIWAVTDLEITF